MTKINVSEAVRRGFGSRSRLTRAIKQGTLAATKKGNGQVFLDLAQLEDVLGTPASENGNAAARVPSLRSEEAFSEPPVLHSEDNSDQQVSVPQGADDIDGTDSQSDRSCLLVLGFGGVVYAVASIGLGAGFLTLAVNVWRYRTGALAHKSAMRLFGFSIFYLFALFASLLIERMAGLAPFAPFV